MEDLKAYLDKQFELVHDRFRYIDKEFDKIHTKLDCIDSELAEVKHRVQHIEGRLDDIERVVRESAEDILENQVEEVARHNLHEDQIRSLQETTFRLDKAVLQLSKRVEKLEAAHE